MTLGSTQPHKNEYYTISEFSEKEKKTMKNRTTTKHQPVEPRKCEGLTRLTAWTVFAMGLP